MKSLSVHVFVLVALLFSLFIEIAPVLAAPTRTSSSSGLFLAYPQPQEVNDGYSDKFYVTTPGGK